MPPRAYCEERLRITVSLGPGNALAGKGRKRCQIGKISASEVSRARFFFSPTPIFSPFPHNADPGPRLDYSETEKTVNTRNISGMLCYEKKKNKTIRHEKTKGQARTLITVCGFVANSRVMIFAVIGHNTINIPEIFQVFTIFLVPL